MSEQDEMDEPARVACPACQLGKPKHHDGTRYEGVFGVYQCWGERPVVYRWTPVKGEPVFIDPREIAVAYGPS